MLSNHVSKSSNTSDLETGPEEEDDVISRWVEITSWDCRGFWFFKLDVSLSRQSRASSKLAVIDADFDEFGPFPERGVLAHWTEGLPPNNEVEVSCCRIENVSLDDVSLSRSSRASSKLATEAGLDESGPFVEVWSATRFNEEIPSDDEVVSWSIENESL